MAATIIQFPQTHSNIFLNLTQLINLASDNQVVEEYAEIMAVCHEEGNFKPGEVETLQEQIRARRLEKEYGCKLEDLNEPDIEEIVFRIRGEYPMSAEYDPAFIAIFYKVDPDWRYNIW